MCELPLPASAVALQEGVSGPICGPFLCGSGARAPSWARHNHLTNCLA